VDWLLESLDEMKYGTVSIGFTVHDGKAVRYNKSRSDETKPLAKSDPVA
jgi:hypothetical protein